MRRKWRHLVLASVLALTGIAVADVGPTYATSCYVWEAGAPYKPAGTSVVRGFGDIRCSAKVYELHIFVTVERSTDGGGSWHGWASRPGGQHCNECTYRSDTISKDCRVSVGNRTYLYRTRVEGRWFEQETMKWYNVQTTRSGARSINC